MASLRDAYGIHKDILEEICEHLKNTSEFHTLVSSRSDMISIHTSVIQCLIQVDVTLYMWIQRGTK